MWTGEKCQLTITCSKYQTFKLPLIRAKSWPIRANLVEQIPLKLSHKSMHNSSYWYYLSFFSYKTWLNVKIKWISFCRLYKVDSKVRYLIKMLKIKITCTQATSLLSNFCNKLVVLHLLTNNFYSPRFQLLFVTICFF